jgi:hypothetical protein
MGDGIGWCGQWTTTTQLATECVDCEKAPMGRGGRGVMAMKTTARRRWWRRATANGDGNKDDDSES